MPISARCPDCNRAFFAPDHAAGEQAFCPSCKATITIPQVKGRLKASPPPVPVDADDEVKLTELPDEPKARRRRPKDDEPDYDREAEEAKKTLGRAWWVLKRFLSSDWRRAPSLATTFLTGLMFLLPMCKVECNGRTIATQNGPQVILGWVSVAPEIEAMEKKQGRPKQEDLPHGYLMFAYGMVLLIGCLLAFAAVLAIVVKIGPQLTTAIHVTGLATAPICLLLLLVQVAIGFPIAQGFNQGMRREMAPFVRPEVRPDPFAPAALAATSSLRIVSSGGTWFTLFLLTTSTVLLAVEGMAAKRLLSRDQSPDDGD